MASGCARADDGVRFGVDGDDAIAAARSGVDEAAVGGELERVGRWADGDSRDDLVRVCAEDEDVAVLGADSPDFGARGMLAQAGERWADWDARDGAEVHEVDDVDVAVLRGDVGVEAQAGRRKEGRCSRASDERERRREAATCGEGSTDAREFLRRSRGSWETQLISDAVEDVGDLADFDSECGEFLGDDGLHAVGEGFFGFVMDFDEEAVGSRPRLRRARREELCGACRCRGMDRP